MVARNYCRVDSILLELQPHVELQPSRNRDVNALFRVEG